MQMKTRSTFIDAGWDFTDTWVMCEGTNYPRLKVQIMPADRVCPDGVNTEDFAYMMQEWMRTNCIPTNDFCGGADVDESGAVDIADFAILAEQWLETGPYFTMLPAVPASEAWWRMDYSPEQGIRDSVGGHHGITCNITQDPCISFGRDHPRQTSVIVLRLDDDKQDNKMPSVDDIRLFINGLPAESAANSTQVIDTAAVQDVQIGSVYNGTTQTGFFKGVLDDVRIFDRALTDEQVRLLYFE